MIKKLIQNVLKKAGYEIRLVGEHRYNEIIPNELEEEFIELYKKVKPYTMTTVERLYSAYKATKYVIDNNLPGAIVECGVWRGGSTMMMALTLIKNKSTDREIYLYDTYEGMPEPDDIDKDIRGDDAEGTWKKNEMDTHNEWCYSSIDEVKSNLFSTGYPKEKLHFVKGKVEETIPGTLPGSISLLRLDTDWYESTLHEMIHLYPLLEKNGVLIIDDYGHWQGARAAVDKYFKENNVKVLLNRIDYTGRLAIKN